MMSQLRDHKTRKIVWLHVALKWRKVECGGSTVVKTGFGIRIGLAYFASLLCAREDGVV